MDIEKYYEATKLLKEKFPPETVKMRDDGTRAFIPNQVYTDRLDRVLQGEWSKEIRELEVNVPHQYVKAIVRVYIGPAYRDGSGIATITTTGLRNAEERAKSSAFVDALDTWELGWRDLAPFNEWGNNPALSHLSDAPLEKTPSLSSIQSLTDHRCIFPDCHQVLIQQDIEVLKLIPNFNITKMKYCVKHLPDAFVRKLEAKRDLLPIAYQERLKDALDKKKR